jgi:two-component system chemotaxis family response regulator WspR
MPFSKLAEPAAFAPQRGMYNIIVLLVEDQRIIADVIRHMLADQSDINFHYCSDAADAVSIAELIKPTVIVQGLVMTGANGTTVDGLTLVAAYRANPATRDIPVVILSATYDPAMKSTAFEAGANDYIVKFPSDIELVARLRSQSKAHIHHLQRDEAYRALRVSQQLLLDKNVELERLTNVDGLTGLNNRKYFDEFTRVQWRQAISARRPYAILMVDIDNFKRYNDTYGHLAGDETLKQVAALVKGCCHGPNDLPARFGGEEFVVYLGTALDGVKQVAQQMCRAVEDSAIVHADSPVSNVVTVSIGCAVTTPGRSASLVALIEAADVALYEAKRSGKNRFAVNEVLSPPDRDRRGSH